MPRNRSESSPEPATAPLKCPHCGEEERFKYVEDTVRTYNVNITNTDGKAIIESWSGSTDDDGSNPRFLCRECFHEFTYDIEIDWD